MENGMMDLIQSEMTTRKNLMSEIEDELQNYIYTACVIATETINHGKKIILFGNGNNALNARYIATKLIGGCDIDKRGLPAICLDATISNEEDRAFDRQIEALAKDGDLLIGISKSGNSKNILRALSLGKHMECRTVGFSGYDGGAMSEFCDVNIIVPSDDTSCIFEAHVMIGNTIIRALKDSLNL